MAVIAARTGELALPNRPEGPATYIVELADGTRLDVPAHAPALAARTITRDHPQATVVRVFTETLDFIWRDQK
jgi:hypothetical protein